MQLLNSTVICVIEDGFERERERERLKLKLGKMAFNAGAHDTLHQRPTEIVVEVCIPFSFASHHHQPQLSSKRLVIALNQG